MQKKDYEYFVGNAWTRYGNKTNFDPADASMLLNRNIEGNLELIDGDHITIMPGITVYTGSKHTYECQYLTVATETGLVLLASDSMWYYYNLDNLKAVPVTMDASAYIANMKKMKSLAGKKRIIPGHDKKVMKLFPQVAEGVVKIQ